MSVMSIQRPFGPLIGKVKLPQQMVDDLNKGCDELVADEEKMRHADFSKQLAGKVRHELSIPPSLLNSHMEYWNETIMDYLSKIDQRVSLGMRTPRYTAAQIGLQEAWFVRSFAGDYNPAHVHPGAMISVAGYLRTPDWEDEIASEEGVEGKQPTGGRIFFSYGIPTEFSTHTVSKLPIVGEAYIFPSMLSHEVYPFKSNGERRSFSLNFGMLALIPDPELAGNKGG